MDYVLRNELKISNLKSLSSLLLTTTISDIISDLHKDFNVNNNAIYIP